jgi:hypothetical protein
MGVAVDESRHHHAASGVDFIGLAREGEILQPSTEPDFLDQAVDNQDGTIMNEPQVARVGTTPGAFRSA